MMLDSHPLLCSPDESGILLEMQGFLDTRWNHLQTFGLTRTQVLKKIKDFFLAFHHNYCLVTGKPVWIDKTPQYVKTLPFIKELFPSCRIIHLIRDGRDVAASFREKWGLRGLLRCLHEWPECIRRGRSSGSKMDVTQYLEIRYESLVQNPRSVLSEVLTFLGVEWDDAVLCHHSKPHATTGYFGWERPLKPVSRGRVGLWRERLRWHERLLVILGFRSLLGELGYLGHWTGGAPFASNVEAACAAFGYLSSRVLAVGERFIKNRRLP